jgi:hypothetical protein
MLGLSRKQMDQLTRSRSRERQRNPISVVRLGERIAFLPSARFSTSTTERTHRVELLPVDVLIASIEQALPGSTAGFSVRAFAGSCCTRATWLRFGTRSAVFNSSPPSRCRFRTTRLGSASLVSLADRADRARPNYSSSIL